MTDKSLAYSVLCETFNTLYMHLELFGIVTPVQRQSFCRHSSSVDSVTCSLTRTFQRRRLICDWSAVRQTTHAQLTSPQKAESVSLSSLRESATIGQQTLTQSSILESATPISR